MTEQPLIYTSKGNLPEASLSCERYWERTPEYVKFIERYSLDGEVVKESCHVLGLEGLECGAAAT
jgi:hypothetical protein